MTSARTCVGWYSFVSPFHTGTPACSASSSTRSWPKPRYSIPSNNRPSTRAVSFIVSLCPIWVPVGPRYVVWAPWVECGDLEGAASTCGSLLEDQGQVPTLETAGLATIGFGNLERSGQLDEVAELGGRKVEELQEAAPKEVDAHRSVFLFGNAPSGTGCLRRLLRSGQWRGCLKRDHGAVDTSYK